MKPNNVKDLTGDVYSRLTVLMYSHSKKYGGGPTHRGSTCAFWVCLCECGNLTIAPGNGLKSNHNKSCGCIRKGRVSPNRKPMGTSAANYRWNTYKSSARVRGLSFDLTVKQLVEIGQKNCSYCGAVAKFRATHKKYWGGMIFNGLDRVDSTRGYSVDNCVPCCSICNYAKSDLTLDEFEAWISQLVAHRTRK